MTRIAILNASPLILLGRIGFIWLLPKLFPASILPSAVFTEIVAQNTPDTLTIRWEVDAGKIIVQTPTSMNVQTVSQVCRKDMALGEIQVLALALDLQDQKQTPLVILDDLPARKTAEVLGFPLLGTLGIIIRALRAQFIKKSESKQIIHKMTKIGAYFDTELIQEVLRIIELTNNNTLP